MADDAGVPDPDALVSRVLGGDTQIFAELIRMFEPEIWRLAASYLRDWNATENIVQQIFIDAYTHLDQYRLGTDFRAWLRTLARNRLRKEFRSVSREKRRVDIYRQQLAERLNSESVRDDDSDAFLTALRGCREELPEGDANLIRLRYEKGLSFEAIARRQDQTPVAVQRMISRIRFRLRACIEGKL